MPWVSYTVNGEVLKKSFDKSAPLTIGRSSANTISFPDDKKISRKHCQFYYYEEGDCYAVGDLKSTNGTLVNGNRIAADVILSENDVVTVGDLEFVFHQVEEITETRKLVKIPKAPPPLVPPSEELELTQAVSDLEEKKLQNLFNAKAKFVLNHGDKVQDYEIIQKIGDGDNSSVYLVKTQSDENALALKMFSKNLVGNREAVSEFTSAFEAAKAVTGTSLVNYLDAGIFKGRCFHVMNYCPNGSLKSRLAKSAPFGEIDSLDILLGVVVALKMAYEASGVVHKNLKPSNILFNSTDNVIITDHGFYKWMSDHIMDDGAPAASPWYISPELVRGESGTWKSDLYSTGIILFQMLTGVLPFHSPDKNALLRLQTSQETPRPEHKNPNVRVSKMTFDIIRRMTAKNPDDRFESWSDLLKKLQDAYDELMKDPDRDRPVEHE